MPAVVRLRRLMFVMPSQEAGISVTPPKPMTSNSKSEGRFGKQDFVYVGADDIYLCPAGERLSYRYTNEEDGKTLRRYWTRRIDGSDPRVRRAPRTWSHRPTISVRVFTQPGSFSTFLPSSSYFRSTLNNGPRRNA